MMEEKIVAIVNEMAEVLSVAQMKKLQETLLRHLAENTAAPQNISNSEYVALFLEAKTVEGCSPRTIAYYRTTIALPFKHRSDRLQRSRFARIWPTIPIALNAPYNRLKINKDHFCSSTIPLISAGRLVWQGHGSQALRQRGF